ncbi:hypothetical protein FA95DRAFT_1603400 [Auriscalpium vulgare]|uniref:Uncharacterized protein n=1 Tax=Auriscalpium vulgare TaxID=40419 RepID=A0ACB8S2F5_9AGAM|nr:hypothetical protein FA95DRAFT_1603400 [Auriscalpium vulgare]
MQNAVLPILLFLFLAAANARHLPIRREAVAGEPNTVWQRWGERMDAVPPAGSSTFNPGTLSHPLSSGGVPVKELLEAEGLPLAPGGSLPGV